MFATALERCHHAQDLFQDVASDFLPLPTKWARWLRRVKLAWNLGKAVWQGTLPEAAGAYAAGKATGQITGAIGRSMVKMVKPRTGTLNANTLHDKRTYKPRARARTERMVIVYHDADRAGRHIDIHIGKMSLVKRLPDDFKVTYNSQGRITDATKKRIQALVAQEFEGRARIAQNLDHSPDDVAFEFITRDAGPSAYGAGRTRQVVSDEPVYISQGEKAVHISAPHIINNKTLYVYQLYPGTKSRAPIMSLGVKRHVQRDVKEKPHLRYMHDLDSFKQRVGRHGRYTVKYDGASCHILITPKGTTIWSPRLSKRDGQRIEYTGKLPGIEKIKGDHDIMGMGEIMFMRNGEYLTSEQIGAVLNAGRFDPSLSYEIRVYRADEGALSVQEVVRLGKQLKAPETVPYGQLCDSGTGEGYVGIPLDSSLDEGCKFKWREELVDGVVQSIDFHPGPKGGITGAIKYMDDKTGKTHKISSGLTNKQKLTMMRYRNRMVGTVITVKGFNGHRNRASTFRSFHSCKGHKPPEAVMEAFNGKHNRSR